MKKIPALAFGFCAALGLAACGQPSSEDLIQDATEQVRLAETELEEARKRVANKEEALVQAREELEDAREAARNAEKRLAEANQHVAEVADDAYLFRAVQSALLSDPALDDRAIAAHVRDGVVTLSGRVSNKDEKKRAGALAAGVPGVKSVKNEVVVELAVQ